MTSRLFALASVVLAICPTVGGAQEANIEGLQKELEQRDKIIIELLQRVEALERRAGMSRTSSADAAKQQERTEDQSSLQSSLSEGQGETAPPDTKATVRTPGEVVVDEEAAERALERSLTQAGALLLRPGRIEVEPSVSYARKEDATPTFVSNGGSTFSGQLERNVDSLTFDLSVRLGLPWDSQLEVGIPYRWRNVENVTNVGFSAVDTSDRTGAGPGDLRVGVAKTLLREGRWQPDLIGRITWDTRTGEAQDSGVDISSDFHELQIGVTAIRRQDPLVFLGGLAYEHVFERNDAQPGDAAALTIGSFVALSPATSMRFVLSQTFRGKTEVEGARVPGSDQTAATFTVGGASVIARGVLLNLSVGIGLTDDADDYSVRLSLPIRF